MITGHRKRERPQKNGKTDIRMGEEEEKLREQTCNRDSEMGENNGSRYTAMSEVTSFIPNNRDPRRTDKIYILNLLM